MIETPWRPRSEWLRLKPISERDDGRTRGERRRDPLRARFYAWTQQQAALMKGGLLGSLDVVNVLEEIESLGRREVSELRSCFKIPTLHLLKEMYQPARAGRSWRLTILNQRQEIAQRIEDNPSLKPKADALYRMAYVSARQLAAEETGLPVAVFPEAPPFSRAQAQSESWQPEPVGPAEDSDDPE